jgi:hypothetical protein
MKWLRLKDWILSDRLLLPYNSHKHKEYIMSPNSNSPEQEITPPVSNPPQQGLTSPRVIQPVSSEVEIRAATAPPQSTASSPMSPPTTVNDVQDPYVANSNQQQDTADTEPSYYTGNTLVTESSTHQLQQPKVNQIKPEKKRKPYLWILFGVVFVIFVMPLVLITMQTLLSGGTDQSRLKQAGEDMSAYLKDKYGMQFNVRDARYQTGVNVSGVKVMTANVSPVNDPSFTYSANVYLHSVLPGQKDSPTYREDFLGEYWKSGFEKIVCPSVRSIKEVFSVTKCSVTSYSLAVDYNKAVAEYKGSVPNFSQLKEDGRKLLTFSLTIETSDGNNLSNVVKHAEFLEKISSIVNTIQAKSNVTYFSNSTKTSEPRLGYMWTVGVNTLNEKVPMINRIYKQDADEPKSVLAKNKLYYNKQTSAFDLPKPLSN